MFPKKESGSAIERAVATLPAGRWLLAVSGGRDSMVLLQAMAATRPGEIVGVATFDHGTGPASTAACELVAQEASARGLLVIRGQAPRGAARTEAAWRAARWAFLRQAATDRGARVVTAHTRDDQIETVVLRLLRGAGPRGLAGMRAADRAPAPVRPLLALPRAEIAAFSARERVPFVEDPSNATLAFQRNRVRHEILPALERASPGFGAWCWALGERAAAWRAEVEACVDALGVQVIRPTQVVVPAGAVARLEVDGWEVLWPAIAARAGVVMDRRGVSRAARWAPTAQAGQQVPLSGGARLLRTRSTYVVQGTVPGAQDYIP